MSTGPESERSRDSGFRVAVVMGGQSAERDVSIRSGRTVARELSRTHRVRPVTILESGTWIIAPGILGDSLDDRDEAWLAAGELGPLEAVARLIQLGTDVAFNALHGPIGEDGTIQGLFRMAGVPLTGPDVIPAAVSMDKRLTKQVILAEGLSTPRFFALPATLGDWIPVVREQARRLPFPWIAKPNRLGSSVGCAIFRDLEEVERRLPGLVAGWPEDARRDAVLVEEVVSGRELTCGVIETIGRPRALPPVEIRPRSSAFFDYDAKYVPGASEEICPAPLSESETRRVEDTALRVHATLGCAPLSRTDMFLTPLGRPPGARDQHVTRHDGDVPHPALRGPRRPPTRDAPRRGRRSRLGPGPGTAGAPGRGRAG